MKKDILHELLEVRPDIAQWHRDFGEYMKGVTKDINTLSEAELKAKYPNYNPNYNPNYVAIRISK